MSEFARAAPPMLGTSLLAVARAHEKETPLPASSGSALIDESALEEGFNYGEITSLAGTSGTGKTLLAYHAIASHLLKHEQEEVALIDTTGAFSPLRLRDVLAFRFEARLQREKYQHSGYMYENAYSKAAVGREELEERATSTLDRVKVMRVFDFAGVVEAVGEIREMREKSSLASEISANADTKRKNEVHDSEEESDAEDEPPTRPVIQPCKQTSGSIGMIVIDTIANVVSSMMSKGQVRSQALLSTFMRSFRHLTVSYNICTILINAVVGLNSAKHSDHQWRPEDHVSAFASTLGKPALGKSFTYMIDASILVSAVPKTCQDAATAFGTNSDLPYAKFLVLEVIKDRCGMREGRWATFEIVAGVKLVPCPG